MYRNTTEMLEIAKNTNNAYTKGKYNGKDQALPFHRLGSYHFFPSIHIYNQDGNGENIV